MEFSIFNEKTDPPSPEKPEGTAGEFSYQDSLEIIRALHTAVVVVRQYPPTNELVIKSVETAYETLKTYLKKNPVLIIGEVAGNLLVDELCFADKDQKKPFVQAMATFLSQRKIRNVTFLPEINFDELHNFLELIGERPERIASIESLNTLLEEKNIKNIKLNEKVYRITSREEQEKEKFKEDILIRFLGGTVPSGLEKDLLSRTLVEGDPQKIVDYLMRISSAEREGLPVSELQVQTIIQFVQKMIELIKTTSNRLIQEKLRHSLASVLSQLETSILVPFFTSDVFSWGDVPGLRESVLNSLSEDKYLKLVGEVAQHYQMVTSAVSPEEKKPKLQPYNQLFEHLLLTPRGKSLAGKIYQQLVDAGIISPSVPQISKVEVKEAPVYKFLLGEDREEEIAARVVAEISPPRLLVLLMRVVQRIVKENVNLGKPTQVARLVEFIQRIARLLPRITNPALREKLKASLAKAISSLESSLLVGLLSHETTSTIPELGFPGTVLSLLPEEKYLDLVELSHQEQKVENVKSRKFLLQQFYNRLLVKPRGSELAEKVRQRLEEPVAKEETIPIPPEIRWRKFLTGETEEEKIDSYLVAELSAPRLAEIFAQTMQEIMLNTPDLKEETRVSRVVEFIQRIARLLPRITNPALREKLKAALAKAISSLESPLLMKVLLREERIDPALGLKENAITGISVEKYQQLVETASHYQNLLSTDPAKNQVEIGHLNRLFLQLLADFKAKFLSAEITQKIMGVFAHPSIIRKEVAPDISLSPVERAKKWIQGEDGVWISPGKIESLSLLIKELDAAGEEGLMLALVEKLLLFSRHPESTIRQRVAVSAMEIWSYAADKEKNVITKIMAERIPVWWEEENTNEVFSSLLTNLDFIIKTSVIKENLDTTAELMERLIKISQQKTTFHQNEVNSLFNRLANEELLNILSNIFEFAEESKQQLAGRILATLGARAARFLIEVLRRAEKMRVRKNALTLLQAVGKESLPDIVTELQRPENPWYLIRNLVFLLGELGDKEVGDFLAPPLSHPDVRVRRETVKALSKIGGEKAASLLISSLYDRDPSVRKATVVALGDLREARAVPGLRNLMSSKSLLDKDPSLQAEVCIALGKIKSPVAVPDLIKIIERKPRFLFRSVREDIVRVSACWALGEIGGPEAKSALGKVSRDSRLAVREAAQKALSQLSK